MKYANSNKKKKRQPLVDFCGQKRTIDPVHADSPTTKFKVSQRTEKKQKNLGIHYSLALSVALRLLYNLNQWTVVKATAGIKTNEKLDQSIDPRSVFFFAAAGSQQFEAGPRWRPFLINFLISLLSMRMLLKRKEKKRTGR